MIRFAAMHPSLRLVSVALLGCGFSVAFAAPESKAAAVTPPAKERFLLFLLAGQSNMAGRGGLHTLSPEARAPEPRVLALNRAGEWQVASDPIHWDKPTAGAGLGKPFGEAIVAAQPGVTVGLIPAACGGSSVAVWAPGKFFDQTNSKPYDDALARVRAAMKVGTLKAILWHQGESDSTPENAPIYEKRLEELIRRFRTDLGMPELPFIIGQLGRFEGKTWDEPAEEVNRAQEAVARRLRKVFFVSSEGLTSADKLHFDAASLEVFAKRYAATYARSGR